LNAAKVLINECDDDNEHYYYNCMLLLSMQWHLEVPSGVQEQCGADLGAKPQKPERPE